MLIHNDPPEKCSEKQFTDFLFQSPFQVVQKEYGKAKGIFTFNCQRLTKV